MTQEKIDRRQFIRDTAVVAAGTVGGLMTLPDLRGSSSVAAVPDPPPNIVVMFYDDMGWGDPGCYGSPIRTPNIDRFANEGMRFTDCVSGSPLCSPSRASLLTGRYGVRVGIPAVMQPSDTTGMNLDETTISNVLKDKGYRTSCVGKWHVGHTGQYLPTHRGFDSYFGIPNSNDQKPVYLMRNDEIIEREVDLTHLTQRYTAECVKFIEESKNSPFFLYYALPFPHVPLAVSPRFLGKSELGLYGDVMEESDWGFGEVLSALRRNGVERNTLVLMASDNGPWWQGNPGAHRARKGNTYEGGIEVPFIARWPGKIRAGTVNKSFVSLIDIFPTVTKLAGGQLPQKPLDGVDIWPVLSGKAESVDRDVFIYFGETWPQCARRGQWKLHMARYNSVRLSGETRRRVSQNSTTLPLARPELYNLDLDPGEDYDVAPRHPEIVKDLAARFNRVVTTLPEEIQRAYAEVVAKKVEPDAEPGSIPLLQSAP